ncbi:MAG: CDP-glycerol glycerophosphotransferase family protein [Coriobacteriia bacterium]|nr:CDP-glycerol glycerophosphotransferase family protein [Coriobacteriia bacterium]
MIIFFRKWILRLAWHTFRPLPQRPRVVFASNHSTRLRGNLKFLHAELSRQAPDVETVLLLHRSCGGWIGKVRTLLAGIRAEYCLATSRVFVVDDYYFPLYVARPKPDTIVLQTWHAAGAFKKVGYSVADKTFGASPSLLRQVRIHSNYTHALVASASAIPYYAEAFGQPPERFVVTGTPRTDLFFDAERLQNSRAKVSRRYRIGTDHPVILYAPTFRGDSAHAARYDDALNLEEMAEHCAGRYLLLLRLHPFVARSVSIPEHLRDFVIDVSDHPDINELMLASDVLVTDYSSAIFEYSLLERPMVFFAPDHEEYERERGFYFDYLSGVPGPVFKTTAELGRYLARGEFDLDSVRRFRDRSFDCADGRASDRAVSEIILPAIRGRES